MDPIAAIVQAAEQQIVAARKDRAEAIEEAARMRRERDDEIHARVTAQRLLKAADRDAAALNAKLQAFCTKVAETMPVEVSWRPGEKMVWGCILTPRFPPGNGYCDECPSKDLCPHPAKEWSKLAVRRWSRTSRR